MIPELDTPKKSRIPVLKKVKVLNPIKSQNDIMCNNNQFKYCRNCCKLKENLDAIEHNVTTLLKENNYLRQQLSIANEHLSDNYNDTSILSSNLNDMYSCSDSVIPSQSNERSLLEVCQNTTSTSDLSDDMNSQPFSLLPGHPFSEFDVHQLDNEVDYSHKLHNRSVKFFGAVPYEYGEITHEPCSVPKESYLLKIIDHVQLLFPQYSFNSVLVNRYANGNSIIPMHADDEHCIQPGSSILTVSLGETRTIKFQPKNNTSGSEISTSLQHGDVFIMSTLSQKLFKHGIPKDHSKSVRISLTFRNLVCPNVPNDVLSQTPSLGIVSQFLLDLSISKPLIGHGTPSIQQVESSASPTDTSASPTVTRSLGMVTPELPASTVDTVFVSSSMFAELDQSKLSSNSHKSAVFFYRGATARGIHHRLQNDPDFIAVDPKPIKQIFLLCGTNDIDNILNVQKNNWSNINVDASNYDEYQLDKTTHDIDNLINYLHNRYPCAKINILNILPRASINRNFVINRLNEYLRNLCSQRVYLTDINTEFRLCLFSKEDGFRKEMFFKQSGSDNVHLNKSGVIRLGKHLKYLVHNI